MVEPINPGEVRYIKLGRGGRWKDASLDRGQIHFGHRDVSHELASSGDWQAATAFLRESVSKTPAKAKDVTREIRDFYELGDDCLWITFARGHLWWTFAQRPVDWVGRDSNGQGQRSRRTTEPWRNTDIRGQPLRTSDLSTKLTQLAAYRGTVCRVREADYLLRRINGLQEPVVDRAQEVRHGMISAATDMITSLHWADFETMVDLNFARSGWQRVTAVGGSQKDVDLILEQPTTGEKAFVQVKSRAGQKVFDDYLQRFQNDGSFHRMFFVCHTPKGRIQQNDLPGIHLWTGDALAEMAVKSGLFDWLIDKVK